MDTHDFTFVKAQILEMTGQQVDELYTMWLRIFEPKTCSEFLHRLKDHTQTFYTDLLNETHEKKCTILDEIAGQQVVGDKLTRLLHKSADILKRPDDVPLVIWQVNLDKSVERMRKELASRREEFCDLLDQQDQLCEELDEIPMTLRVDPLPEEMDAFRDHLEELRHRRELRLKKINELRQSIRNNMKILGLFPITASEIQLLNEENQTAKHEVLIKLCQMQQGYALQIQELHEQIDEMRQKIETLWTRLPQTDDFAKRRVRESTAYTQRTYDVLLEELQRCQSVRIQNQDTFIAQLRVEIDEWWDLTLKSPQERERFTSNVTDSQSEDVLELYEMELDRLKDFYNGNKRVFELYAKRAELWARMEALEAKANDPNRFNNRGGQLLKEEKERKAISSKLPKIEHQITDLVQAYVSQANTAFLVNGEDILKSMTADWERLRHPKQQPSVRKKQELSGAVSKMMPPWAPLTPNTQKSRIGMYGSASSLKKSPTKMELTNASNSTGNLQKRRHPNVGIASPRSAAAAKRNLTTSLECSNSAPLLAVNLQRKLPKSPQKKIRVLEHSLRRGKPSGRPSVGRSRRPIPQVRIQAPSSEENESEDSGGGAEPYSP